MDLYRAFRGADPNPLSLLIARGLVEVEETAPKAEEQNAPKLTIEEL